MQYRACQNKNGDTLLHVACVEGDLAIVKALTSGQDCTACNCQNKKGDTPLHVACNEDHVDIVRYTSQCPHDPHYKPHAVEYHLSCFDSYMPCNLVHW